MKKGKLLKSLDSHVSGPHLQATIAELQLMAERISELEETNSKLREHILLRDSVERAIAREFKSQVEQRDSVIRGLETAKPEKGTGYRAIARELSAELEIARSQIDELNQELGRKSEKLGSKREISEQLKIRDYEIERLKSSVAELESVNSKLREHILLRDSVERAIAREFKSQVEQRDSVIRGLETAKPEKGTGYRAIARELSAELEIARSQIDELNQELGRKSEKLGSKREISEQLKIRDYEIERLKSSVAELESVNSKLREHILLRDSVERAITQEFKGQIAEKEEMIMKLEQSRIGSAGNEYSTIANEMSSELGEAKSQMQILGRKLEEKTAEMQRLLGHHKNKEQAYDDVYAQLSEQMKQKNFEIERLKGFIAEREELMQRMEEQLGKEIALKDSELRELRHTKSFGKALQLERQLEHSHQVIKLKEASARKAFLEAAKEREEKAIMQKRLEDTNLGTEHQREQYEKIIGTIKKDSEKTIKGIISDYTERETQQKMESEKLKSLLSQKQAELDVERQKIDSALKEFAIRAGQVMGIREQLLPSEREITIAVQRAQPIQPALDAEEHREKIKSMREGLFRKDREISQKDTAVRQKEQEILGKESEMRSMINLVEQRVMNLESREKSLETREQILSRQQEAFNSQLQSIQKPGHAKADSMLERHVKEAPRQPETITQLKPAKQEAVNIKPALREVRKEQPVIVKPEIAKQEIKPEPKPTPKPMQEAQRPPRPIDIRQPGSGQIDLKEQTLGYSEVDEVKAMIEVALEHKDSVDQIRKSLVSSGYSKESIDKALSQISLSQGA